MIKNTLDSMQPQSENLYGIFRGVVEDNKTDPLKAGRCKIRIWGIHTDLKVKNDTEGIPTDELPWAEPALGLLEGGVSGNGSFEIPLQGSHVFVFFENGNILKPIYFASAPGVPKEKPTSTRGFSDPDGEYPSEDYLNEADWNRLGRNEKTDETLIKTKNDNLKKEVSTASGGSWSEPESYYNAEYPNNKVYSTNSGITIEIDDTDGEERIHIYHPSNSYIEINKDGSIIFKNSKDKFEIVSGESKVSIEGNKTETVEKDKETKVQKNMTIKVDGNTEINTTGRTLIHSDGETNIEGENITLNEESSTEAKIVTTSHICAFTGLPHLHGSPTTYADGDY